MGAVKSALLTLIGLAFVAMGIFLLVRGDPQDVTLAWGIIAFFGACAAVGPGPAAAEATRATRSRRRARVAPAA